MSQFILVSNRLPVSVRKKKNQIEYYQSMGGLATGLGSFHRQQQATWIGWCGMTSDELTADDRSEIDRKLWTNFRCRSLYFSKTETELYYNGFCNRTLWPLFHNFPTFVAYNENQWQCYRKMNEVFREAVLQCAHDDDTVWIHDYHLTLLPQLLRENLPDIKIGFFLHIPFPSFEIYRLLPWRKEILHGLAGANLIGFHTHDYARHFFDSMRRLLGAEHSYGEYQFNQHTLSVDTFPMGIDFKRFRENQEPVKEGSALQSILRDQKQVILSVDRLDYTKGILQRLEAFDLFLERHPEYCKQVTLLLIAVPSRTRVASYQRLKDQLDREVGRLNGKYGSIEWMPVWYFFRGFPLRELIELYRIADVALITPIRDGMNLIAKEFVAAQTVKQGGLILSEMTGAACELPEALIVNPNNTSEVADAIFNALDMPDEEWARRNRYMRERIRRYDIHTWVHDFITHLETSAKQVHINDTLVIHDEIRAKLFEQFQNSNYRLFLFDLDGELMTRNNLLFNRHGIERTLAETIARLSISDGNEIVLLSGLDQEKLTGMFDHSSVHLYADQGAWIREYEAEWHEYVHPETSWKRVVRPILEMFVSRTPGSYIEERTYSLFWRYEKVSPALKEVRIAELKDTLISLIANHDVKIAQGFSYLEIRSSSLSKARHVSFWLAKQTWDFILAVGDDWADEEIFTVLPATAHSIKIGSERTSARFRTSEPVDMHQLLSMLAFESGRTGRAVFK